MRSPLRLLLLIFLGLSLRGVVETSFAQTTPASSRLTPSKRLRRDLDRIFADPRLVRAQIGMKVVSLDQPETLYEKNPQQLLIPASSNKIITAAVTLVRLGADYRFETRLWTDGQIEDGDLKGNLIIAGTGDPTHSSKFSDGNPFAAFQTWARNLKERNIRAISGSILGSEGSFGASAVGQGWEWDDLSHAYAAPAASLQFNDNMVALSMTPGGEPGNPARITGSPLDGYLKIVNQTVTGQAGVSADIRIQKADSDESIIISGTVPAKGSGLQQNVAIRFPTLYYLAALRHVFSEEGIAVENIAAMDKPLDPSSLLLLVNHESPALAEILRPLLKNSINLYAETLLRTLGLRFRGEGTSARGKEIVEETLTQMGIATGTYSYVDGSGLSRLNLESAESFVQLLKYMYRDKNFQAFYDALPVAGVDGTLASRMKRTKAEDNLHAKTGSMANVSSLSGYINTADGEMLAVSILLNGYIGPRDAVESLQDKALIRLSGFSRKTGIQKSGVRSQKSEEKRR